MKNRILLLSILVIQSLVLFAQTDYTHDVSSADNIVAALYDVISGEKGEARDWDRFKNLFTPDAKLIPIVIDKGGTAKCQPMTPDGYIDRAGAYLVEKGFFEKEISRKMEEYGPLVHLWSTYESYHSEADEDPFARGINSIQLLNDGKRWWVVQIYWLGESEANPLPTQYLPRD